jgi:hypothetical protein
MRVGEQRESQKEKKTLGVDSKNIPVLLWPELF